MILSSFFSLRQSYLVLALIYGVIGTLSFSPYNFWPAALISLFGLQTLLLNKHFIQTSAIGFIWGIGLFFSGINWIYISIANFGRMPTAINIFIVMLLISYLSFYPMLFAILMNCFWPYPSLCRFSLAAPALWHITEFSRSYILTGFPWLQFGYSQIDGPLKGLAPLAGVEAITFLLMIITGLFAHAFYNRALKSAMAAITIIFICQWSIKLRWYQSIPEHSINIAIIQGNIPQSIKWDTKQLIHTLNIYTSYTHRWMDKVSIIIWPESAITDLESNQQPFLHALDHELRAHGSALVTGIIDSDIEHNNCRNYNSLIVLGDTESYSYHNQNRYQKNHLVPFGEFMPQEKLLRYLAPFFNFPMSSFSHGNYLQRPLRIAGYNFTCSICYEIILGEQIRENLHPDTNCLLTISNDAWFGRSIGPWQHFQMARMRALELGRPLLCATNNGISAVINANGNVEKMIPPFTRQVLNSKVTFTTGQTPYSKFGVRPVWLCTLINLIIANIGRRK
ncbi:apolipoprotein N-acyltransferase [Candidatus Pantoea carbekii]|nr:apolipoprotein N-acyltransferase [Candidatus Pantoea carbekii]